MPLDQPKIISQMPKLDASMKHVECKLKEKKVGKSLYNVVRFAANKSLLSLPTQLKR